MTWFIEPEALAELQNRIVGNRLAPRAQSRLQLLIAKGWVLQTECNFEKAILFFKLCLTLRLICEQKFQNSLNISPKVRLTIPNSYFLT